MEAKSASVGCHDAFDLSRFGDMATVVNSGSGDERLVLSDGYRRIRIDVRRGTLCGGPVLVRYELQGLANIEAKILTIRRLVSLNRLGRFTRHLHPRERLAPRWISALRVYDALGQAISHREIAAVLYGERSSTVGRESGSDFLRLRIQRLARLGRCMVAGGYQALLR